MLSSQSDSKLASPAISVWLERLIVSLLGLAATLPLLAIAAIFGVFIHESWLFFQQVPLWQFLTDRQWTPLFYSQKFGIGVLLSATVMVSAIALTIALPLGLLAAIYLREYAPKWVRRSLKPLLEALAGTPTIVYGYVALLFVTPFLQQFIPGLSIFNSLSAGLMTGLLIIPIVSTLSEEALRSVPGSLRQAASACGMTRQEVITRLLIPAARPGIIAAFTLAASRALGETMIAAIAAGQNPQLSFNPLIPVETMTAFIVQVSLGDVPTDSLIFQTIFAVGMVLFLVTLALNSVGYGLVRRYRQQMAGQRLPSAVVPSTDEAVVAPAQRQLDLGRFVPQWWRRHWQDRLLAAAGLGAALVGPIFFAILIGLPLRSGFSRLSWQFLTSATSRDPEQAGIWAALMGTLWLLGLTSMIALPLGLAAAVFLEEYLPDGPWSKAIEVALANATAIPGILYGLLGLAVFGRALAGLTGGRTIIAAALTMVLLVLPLWITAARSALQAVPRSLKASGYAVGMSREQVIWWITLPAARSGLITGILLTLSRVLGETSPLIALGAVEFITFVPTPTQLQVPFTTLTTQIFFWLSRPQEIFQANAAAAVLVLGAILIAFNVLAGMLRERGPQLP